MIGNPNNATRLRFAQHERENTTKRDKTDLYLIQRLFDAAKPFSAEGLTKYPESAKLSP